MPDFSEEELTNERWLPVVGWEGRYEVSDLGRIKSLDRVTWAYPKNGKKPYGRLHKGTLIIPWLTSQKKYHTIALCKEGIVTHKDIHVIVIAAFKGPRPLDLDVCHNNGKCIDNRLNNLRYDTCAANIEDMRGHGKMQIGVDNPAAKLAEGQVRYIRKMRGRVFQRELGEMFGVNQTIISKVQRRLSYYNIADAS